MINEFENITYELTEYEINKLLKPMINGLKTKIGIENAITNKQIVNAMKLNFKISEVRVRKLIAYIRVNNLVPLLIANGKNGYYISSNTEEIQNYIDGLDSRINAIKEIRDAIKSQLYQSI